MKFKTILKHFLIWQTLIIVIVTISVGTLPIRLSDSYLGGGITKFLKNPILNFRSNFDGVHYVLISTHGYNYGQQAFFPFYSSLIKSLNKYTKASILSGTLISSLAFVLALYFLTKLVKLDYPVHVSFWLVLILMYSPVSFFFTSVYTEGLFLLLTVLSFYCARKGHWLLAGIFGFFASYTRFIGIFLFPALAIELWEQKKPIAKAWPLLLIPLGLLTYMLYLNQTTGDPFAFYHLQKIFNQSRDTQITMPYQVIWRYIRMVATVNRADPLYITIWLEFITGLGFLVLSVVSLFKQRLSYAFFNFAAYLIPTLTGNFVSLPRYVLICFPVYIILAQYISDHPRFRKVYLAANFIFMTVYLSMFARGYWVA